jgi:ribonuclease BN (tRNA processing enzyme)
MKIRMIGTGAISSNRNSANTLIDDAILMDIPNGSVKAMKNQCIDINKIDYIFITHFHGDHYFDIPFILLNYKFNKREKKIHIIGPQGIKERAKILCDMAFPSLFNEMSSILEFIEVEDKQIIDCSNFKVEAIKTVHSDNLESYGYIITKENKSIGYTGDITLCDAAKYITSNTDICIVDMALIVGDESHMGIDNIKELVINSKRIIPTHMVDNTYNEINKSNIDNVSVLNDGESIEEI